MKKEEVKPNDGQTQADFSCEISWFNTPKDITSFVLSHSDYVTGIPYEEILFDPVKADEAIKDKILLDYSVDDNKIKLPPLFIPSAIDGNNCEEKGEFKITTNDSIEIGNKLQFNILVTYPEEFMTECYANAGTVSEIKCIIGNNYCVECNEEETLCDKCDIGYFPDENGGCLVANNCEISYKGQYLECKNNYGLIGSRNYYQSINDYLKICKSLNSDYLLYCRSFNYDRGYCF